LEPTWTPSGDSGTKLTEDDVVRTITPRVREIIAGNRYTLLKEMVRMGIIRLVVDYGEIETRLTFTTYGDEPARQNSGKSLSELERFGVILWPDCTNSS
jgi:hypothetical protein